MKRGQLKCRCESCNGFVWDRVDTLLALSAVALVAWLAVIFRSTFS